MYLCMQLPAPLLAHVQGTITASLVALGEQGAAPAGARGVLAPLFLSLCAAAGGAKRKLTK